MFKLLKNVDYKKIENRISEIDKEISEFDKSKEKKKKNIQLQKTDIEKLNSTLNLKKEKADLLLVNLELLNEENEKNKAELSKLEELTQKATIELEVLTSKFNTHNSNKNDLSKKYDALKLKTEQLTSERTAICSMISHVESELKKTQEEISQLETVAGKLELELAHVQHEYNEKNSIYALSSAEVSKLKSSIEEKRLKIAEYAEKLNFEEKDLLRLNASFEILASEDSNCEKQLQDIKDEILRVEQKKNIIESVISDYKNEVGATRLNNTSINKILELKRTEIAEKEAEKLSLENELEKLKFEYAEKQQEEQALLRKQSDIQMKMSKLQSSVYESQRDRDSYIERISDLEVELTSLSADLGYKEQELARFQSENVTTQRALDNKQVEFDSLKGEVARINKEIDSCLKDSESKKTTLLKLDASISSLKEQLKVQYDSLTEYSERRKITSDELEVAQIRYNNLFEEVSKVYREWTEEKINFEDVEKRLSSLNLECATLNSRLASVNGQRDDLSKELSVVNSKLSESINSKKLIEQEIQKNESELEYLKITTDHITKKFNEINSEISDLTKRNSALDSDKKILEFKSAEALKEKNAATSALNLKTEQLNNLEISIADLTKNLSQLDVEVAARKNELEHVTAQIARTEVQYTDLQALLKNQNSENAKLKSQLESLGAELKNVTSDYELSEIQYNNSIREKGNLLSRIDELEVEKVSVEQKIELNSAEIVRLNREIDNVTAKKDELEIELKSLEDLNAILQNDYEVSSKRYAEVLELNEALEGKLVSGKINIQNLEEESVQLANRHQEVVTGIQNLEKAISTQNKLKESKVLELNQVTHKLNSINQEYSDLKTTSENLAEEVSEINNQILQKTEEEKNVEKFKLELVSSVDELERKKLTSQAKLRAITVRETELSNLQRTFSSEKNALVNEIAKLEGSLSDRERNIISLQVKNESDFKEIKELRKAYAELLQTVQSKKVSLESNSSSGQTMQAERSKLRKKIAELQAIEKNIDQDFERKRKESIDVSSDIENLKSKIATLEESIVTKKNRNEEVESSLKDQSVTRATLSTKRDELNQISKEALKTKKVSPSNLTESLILKIENYLAKMSFNSNLFVKTVTDNDANREILTMFYTNLNRVLDSFEAVEDITLELGSTAGRISIKGKYKKDLETVRSEQNKKNILLMFRTLRESHVGDVLIDANKMMINYSSYSFEREKGF